MIALSVKNLTVSYENKIAIDNISFNLELSDYLCIVGENGSGKSTLIKSILGLKSIKSGKIEFKNGIKQTEIGYLPQQTIIQKDFPASVFEVVLSGCLNKKGLISFYSKKEKQRAESIMEYLSILNIKKKSYRDLSGGQQQRVLLARALCATEKILILDEPVSGLDPIITAEFYQLLNKLNKENNITIIMVSHDITTSIQNANKILHMNRNINFFGNTSEYINNSISRNFIGD